MTLIVAYTLSQTYWPKYLTFQLKDFQLPQGAKPGFKQKKYELTTYDWLLIFIFYFCNEFLLYICFGIMIYGLWLFGLICGEGPIF